MEQQKHDIKIRVDIKTVGLAPIHQMCHHPAPPFKLWLLALTILIGVPRASAQCYEWSTLAGTGGGGGFRDGQLGVAAFKGPKAVAIDAAGNLYLADSSNHTIRRITTSGAVTTLAGKGGIRGSRDGTGGFARFNNPGGIAVDGLGNVYVADTDNHTIRKISPAGEVTTLAGEAGIPGSSDGAGNAARFFSPASVTLAPNGDLFVADTANHLIRRITPGGSVTTIAGQAGITGSSNGNTGVALFNTPRGVAIDEADTLYVTDSANRVVRKITADGNVTTIAGTTGVAGSLDGIGTAARFSNPNGILVDASHNLYITDFNTRTVRKIAGADNSVTTLAGKAGGFGSADGTGASAQFTRPGGMAFASDGSLLVADSGNTTLRNVTLAGVVTTLAANPPAEAGAVDAAGDGARFRSPFGLHVDGAGTVHIADTGNRTIRKITPSGEVSTFVGTAGLSGTTDASGSEARFISPRAVTLGPDGIVYVADVVDTQNSTIRKISPAGEVTTLAGVPGSLTPAETLYFVTGVAVDSSGNVFASDLNSIRKITPQGVVSRLAGGERWIVTFSNGETVMGWKSGSIDGTGTAATFFQPGGVVIDGNRNLFVTESGGNVIRKVTPTGLATTLGGKNEGVSAIPAANDGTGSAARFNAPRGIAVDPQGNLYIADSANHIIRRMSPTGVVTTIGGLPGYPGSGVGAGDRALFNEPSAIGIDAGGNLYVADTLNQRIVKGVPLPVPEIAVQHPDGSHLASGGTGLDFGSVVPASTARALTVAVHNSGNTPLDITNLELTGGDVSNFAFDASGLANSIPPNGSGVIHVTFTPDGLGIRHASLRISNNDPDESDFEVTLRGTGNSLPVFAGYAISSPPVTTVSISTTKLLAAAFDPDGDALTVTSVRWPAASGGGIAVQDGAILFSPSSPYFSGTWTFLATITDARGGSVTGNVSVTWQNSTTSGPGTMTTNPPKLTMQPDGKANVAFHGIPGRLYLIQRSLTLATWENVATVTADASGNVVYLDPAPPKPNAYYRIGIP